jgi:hypothetical protein
MAICFWGVLSGILLRGWESQPHGEGPDGSTQAAKETYTGHVGLGIISKPHCSEQLLDHVTGKCDGLRGSECNRRTGCGKTARPGLCGGCRATGVPITRSQRKMTYFPELQECDYFKIEHGCRLVAIGWLEAGESFSTGSVEKNFFQKISGLLNDPWQPLATAGSHECSLCQFEGEIGNKNILVPFDGRIYVAPELILHYVNCHHYKPPAVFVEAVMNCPDSRNMEYKKKLLNNGGRDLIRSRR